MSESKPDTQLEVTMELLHAASVPGFTAAHATMFRS